MSKCAVRSAVALLLSGVLITVAAPAMGEKVTAHRHRVSIGVIHFVKHYDKSSPYLNFRPDGTEQPLDVSGRLHLESTALVDDDGEVIGLGLHANLMNAVASSPGGQSRLEAVGSVKTSWRLADTCLRVETCGPVWSLTFTLAPAGPAAVHGQDGNGSFVLQLATRYDADGQLVSAEISADRADGEPPPTLPR